MLLEEAYEVMEAIEDGKLQELKKELGDILLHVVMHSIIAEETNTFSLIDVMETEMEKLIHRHPHVFGDTQVSGANQVKDNWEKLKLKEQGRDSLLDGVPRSLPALQRAERLQQKAASVGFEWNDIAQVWKKVEEEITELRHEVDTHAPVEHIEDEFGDILFALVNYARFLKINPEYALRRSSEKFIARFHFIERKLSEQHKDITVTSLEEMDVLWEEAKEIL